MRPAHSLLLATSALVSAGPVAKRDFPQPEPCSGACSGYVHDPAVVLRNDGTYFWFTTNDLINIATAPSMAGPWTQQGSMIQGASVINKPGNNDLWAPDVFLNPSDNTYYGFYAVSAIGSQNSDIGVATSPSMDAGSWTDRGSIGIPDNSNYNKIDPNHFQKSPSDPPLITWGSYWDGIYQATINDPPFGIQGNINHLAQNFTGIDSIEGSYQFWWPVGGTDYYYLFFSSGACCNTAGNLAPPGGEYKIMVCRSTSPTGGFYDQNGNDCLQSGGTLVLGSSGDVYAPGGQGVMYDPGVGSVVVYYHYVRPSVGYNYDQFFFGYNKLDFSSGWPVIVS